MYMHVCDHSACMCTPLHIHVPHTRMCGIFRMFFFVVVTQNFNVYRFSQPQILKALNKFKCLIKVYNMHTLMLNA